MVNPVPHSVEKIWEECNVQVFVLLSLFLQTFLLLVAPFRKRTASLTVTALLWSAYLLADWVASVAVGLISGSSQLRSKKNPNGDLFAFWASFLLLHLGGPDTITAFSLEDSALWLRHFLGLVFQVFASGYIVLLSLPSNSLLVSTALVFVAGIVKYAERTRALYLVSSDVVFDEHALKGDRPHIFFCREDEKDQILWRDIVSAIKLEERSCLDHDAALIICARNYYEVFRGLNYKSIKPSHKAYKEITGCLLMENPERAMKMFSLQLNWLYQNLYTKAVVVRSNWGYVLRFVSFSAIVATLFVFPLIDQKKRDDFDNVYVLITYILLGGAILLDTTSFFMLMLTDWTFSDIYMIYSRLGRHPGVIRFFHRYYLKLRRPNWARNSRSETSSMSSFLDWGRKILFRRWSESVSGFNLIEYSLRENNRNARGHKMINCLENVYVRAIALFGMKDLRDRLKYVTRKPLSKELWDFLLEEEFACFENAAYYTKRGRDEEARAFGTGAYTLRRRGHQNGLISHIAKLQYEESLLVWHIATEICYNTTDKGDDLNRLREFSKVLSDYMVYLLIVQPEVVSSTPGVQRERYDKTCEMVQRVVTDAGLERESELKQACKVIFETYKKRVQMAGEEHVRPPENALDCGSSLAILLEEFKREKWTAISAAWVELLAYGAYNSTPKSHARLLIGGGELISHVWMAIAHFVFYRTYTNVKIPR